MAQLRALLGSDRVSTRDEDRATYSRDMWTRGLLAVAARQPPGPSPCAVVWPQTAAEVQAIVRLCRRYRVPLVPFGAGSGVTGAALPAAGGLVVDMKRMRALQVDAEQHRITCEPGLLGAHLEEQLNRRGLTLGHFPSSIMCSTVGGWLATRGAGQMSTKYGKIEDLVQSIEFVTGTGEILRLDNGDGGGPDLLQLFVGSEGALGIITSATFAVRPLPAARRLRGYIFPDVASGCAAIRQLLQSGLRPAVVRLYDELDTLISGAGRHSTAVSKRPRELAGELEGAASWVLQQLGSRVGKLELGSPAHPPLELEDLFKLLKPDALRAKSRLERWLIQTVLSQAQPVNRLIEALMPRLSIGCLLILGFEGEEALTAAEEEHSRSELLRLGARDLGEEPGQHWLRHRYDVAFKMPKAFAAGAFVDTLEVATTWDRLGALYRDVRAALGQQALVMAHFSHAYPDGCSIYFTLMARSLATSTSSEPDAAQAFLNADRRCYDSLWQGAMQAALRVGATISHHHGIGRLRTPHMAGEHGASLELLQALKKVCDPDGLCNPGNLLAAGAGPTPAAPALEPPRSPAELFASLRSLLGPEGFMEGEAPRCTVRNTAQVQAVLRAARAHQAAVRCTDSLPPGAAVRLDLSELTQVAPVRLEALLVEAQCGITLWQLEKQLREKGLSLGALPPWAWTRTLGAALARPQPAEASLAAGRLRDRRVRITAVLATGQELTAPPTPAPRRAAGPELAQVLLGGGDAAGVLTAAMLRVSRFVPEESWLGLLLDDEEDAVRAIAAARALHGGTALSEVLLLRRELLARTSDLQTLPPGRLALLAMGAGPAPTATAALQLLRERIPGAQATLPDAACSALLRPAGVFAAAATRDDLMRLAGGWPQHQCLLSGTFSDQAALLRAQQGPYLVCGVHLHGAALVSSLPAAGAADAEPPAPVAQDLLWRRLQATVLGEPFPPAPQV